MYACGCMKCKLGQSLGCSLCLSNLASLCLGIVERISLGRKMLFFEKRQGIQPWRPVSYVVFLRLQKKVPNTVETHWILVAVMYVNSFEFSTNYTDQGTLLTLSLIRNYLPFSSVLFPQLDSEFLKVRKHCVFFFFFLDHNTILS